MSTGLWEKLLPSRNIRLASYLPDMVLQPMFNKITATVNKSKNTSDGKKFLSEVFFDLFIKYRLYRRLFE